MGLTGGALVRSGGGGPWAVGLVAIKLIKGERPAQSTCLYLPILIIVYPAVGKEFLTIKKNKIKLFSSLDCLTAKSDGSHVTTTGL